MTEKRIPPIHPGEILLEEFLVPMDISQYRLSQDINVQQTRISEIVKGKRAITADTALRLGIYFKMGASFWLGLQMKYDLAVIQDLLEEQLRKEIQPYPV